MATTFNRNANLPLTDLSRQEFYDLMEQLIPQNALCDDSDATTDQTLTVSGQLVRANMNVPRWKKFTVDVDDLDTAGTGHVESLFALGTTGVVHAVYMKHNTAFSGGGATSCAVSVGYAGGVTAYAGAFDVFQAVAAATNQMNTVVASNAAISVPGTTVVADFNSDVNCDTLTAGEVDIWVLYSECY